MAEVRRPRQNTHSGAEIRKSAQDQRSRDANKRVTVMKATEIRNVQNQI